MEERRDETLPAADSGRRSAELLEIATGYMRSRILLTAARLGIFEAIAEGASSPRDVAGRVVADPRAVAILLDALAAMGILLKLDGAFRLSSEAREALAGGGASSVADVLAHFDNQWDVWSRLTEAVRTGASHLQPLPEAAPREFAKAMRRLSAGRAEAIARLAQCPPEARVLDLGCGAGGYAMAIARAYPGVSVVGIDRDADALDLAADAMRAEGLETRVSLRRGDFFEDPLGEGYDLVLLGSLLVLFGEEDCLRLLGRVKACLAPGGRVGISEQLLEETRTAPEPSAVFAVHLLLNGCAGRVHTKGEVMGWLKDLGFEGVHGIPMGPFCWIVGRRPQGRRER